MYPSLLFYMCTCNVKIKESNDELLRCEHCKHVSLKINYIIYLHTPWFFHAQLSQHFYQRANTEGKVLFQLN